MQRRRERGRRSQAAFRKRQARAAQDLTEQRQQLITQVRRVLDTAKGDERPEMLEALRRLAEVAGIDFTKQVLYEGIKSSSISDITIDVATRDTANSFSLLKDDPSGLLTPSSAPSQRITCSVWLNPDHYMRISLPPQDIIPYIGPGSKTFAGRLFWSVLEHCQGGCKDHHAEPTTIMQQGLRHSKVMEDVKVPFIKAMVDARLEYKRTGSISPEYSGAAEEDLGMVVHEQIKEEYRARGKDPGMWLSCVAIEKRVRDMAGSVLFSELEKAAGGQGNPTLTALLCSVECRLCDTGVCFGDGPRWNVEIVDRLYLELIKHAWELSYS